ncbi:MAG: EVE domain-containing protein [Candidatus Cloacimonetes bacterium]|nr:EVE domain-containing protein [Candidatus Cloacimonadota bacterium]
MSVGKAKLTEAFFMVDPDFYLCVDGQTRPYLKEVMGIDPRFNTYDEYLGILEKVRSKTDTPFPELSYEAWKWNATQSKKNYWVFQCNPNVYDIVSALRGKTEARWRVAQHTKDIEVGDKVILWVTGPQAGCYALGEISGEIEYGVRDIEDQEFYKDNSFNVPGDRVMIRLDHNLVERPILRSVIEGIKDLKDLNVGFQGTNFKATEKQYLALEKLAKGESIPKGSKRYWLFSPGRNAEAWDKFRSEGYMAIGWTNLGDLEQYSSQAEVEEKLLDLSAQDEGKKYNDALANWQFKTEMKPGDVVIVKKGRTTLLGYGEVTSDYYFDPSLDHYQKCRKVEWKLRDEWSVDHSLAMKTLTDITPYKSDHPDYEYYYQRLLAIMGVDGAIYRPLPLDKPISISSHPLNQILFGPPGTGKTYNSVNLAVEITDPGFMGVNRTREQITRRYRELVDEGRIVFTTFHQSMSYEDFIEGIKPVTYQNNHGSIGYEVVDGIFKRLCAQASSRVRRSPSADDGSYEFNAGDQESDSNFEEAYTELCEDLATMPKPVMKVKTPNGAEFGISLNSKGNLTVHTAPEFRPGVTLTRENILAHATGGEVPPYDKGYFQGVLNLLAANYGYEAGNQTVPPIQTAGTPLPHVLIIDEINRGNVSQIFGELITLIEPDKRAGQSEALETVLPYSKEKFSVPANLFIIGTMNTADRSVEALDTALRRRFSFREMKPEYGLLAGHEDSGIPLDALLRTINLRIEGILDKDHAIGHSYFLRVARRETSLKEVLFNEIIPLLQEYFYGNFGRIELVLGSGFVKSAPVTQDSFALPSPDNEAFSDHTRYSLVTAGELDDAAFAEALRVLMKESDEA